MAVRRAAVQSSPGRACPGRADSLGKVTFVLEGITSAQNCQKTFTQATMSDMFYITQVVSYSPSLAFKINQAIEPKEESLIVKHPGWQQNEQKPT